MEAHGFIRKTLGRTRMIFRWCRACTRICTRIYQRRWDDSTYWFILIDWLMKWKCFRWWHSPITCFPMNLHHFWDMQKLPNICNRMRSRLICSNSSRLLYQSISNNWSINFSLKPTSPTYPTHRNLAHFASPTTITVILLTNAVPNPNSTPYLCATVITVLRWCLMYRIQPYSKVWPYNWLGKNIQNPRHPISQSRLP